MKEKKRYPVYHQGKKYTEETAYPLFDAFYTGDNQNEFGYVYVFDGLWVAPNYDCVDEEEGDDFFTPYNRYYDYHELMGIEINE